MKKEILLSISILISNRPDTVEKCLQSLASLRKKVPCELILTDTGCGEKVRSIIEAYADVLLDFEWCNDFSKARNLGLDHAKGEWFLYMDDDEWFEDTKEIEDFFMSGDYKEYARAYYIVRNYRDLEGLHYDDAITPRMTRLEKNIRFYSAIHEGLYILPGKTKVLGSYAHHYGYVFATEADRYKHAQRNLPPLLKEYKADPYNLQYAVQIAQEYNSIREYRKSIEMSLEGIANFSPQKTTVLYLNALCINIVERHVRLFLYEDAVSYGEKYLQDERITNMGRARILAPMVIALYRLNQYEECAKRVEEYMQLYRDYLQNKEVYQEQSSYMMYGCFTNDEQCNVMLIGTAVNLFLGKYDEAEAIFANINVEENVIMLDSLLYEHAVKAYVKADEITENHPCVMILNRLLKQEVIHPKLIGYFEEERKNALKEFARQSYKWQYLAGDCWYLDYLKLSAKPDDCFAEYQKLWKHAEKVLAKSIELGIWEMAEVCSVDMGVIIEELPYYKWRSAVNEALSVLKTEQRAKLHEHIVSACNENDNRVLYWNSCYYHKFLAEWEDLAEQSSETMQSRVESLVEQFVCFADNSITLAGRLYQEEVLMNDRDMLPEYMQAAIHVADLLQYTEQGDYAMAIRELKEIKDVLPSVAIAVKVYTQWIELQVKSEKLKSETEKQAVNVELQQLAQAVKEKILFFLREGNKEVAAQLIGQLEAITGPNPELEELKKQAE